MAQPGEREKGNRLSNGRCLILILLVVVCIFIYAPLLPLATISLYLTPTQVERMSKQNWAPESCEHLAKDERIALATTLKR